MAKTVVYKEPDNDKAPFLRGILTQSLVNTGLTFEDAYQMAQDVRNELKDVDEISSSDLKKLVSRLLETRFGSELAERYHQELADNDIIVHTPTNSGPFSLSELAHSLSTYAIKYEVALEGAKKVYASLKQTGHTEIDHKTLRRIVYRCLQDHCSPEVADRYLSWRRFENSGTPLILAIGGVSGSGKSTLSTELAYRLNIPRVQSTDMIREIIRAYLAMPVAPTLQYSSFEAWRGLPSLENDSKDGELDNPVVTGFLSQFMTLKPALNATIDRSLVEKEHLIIEGTHVLPTELDLDKIKNDALVIPVMIASLDKKKLLKRLLRRRRDDDRRNPSRYNKHLDQIWDLQSYLLDVSDHAGVPIIHNTTLKNTIREILEIISAKILKRFPPNPKLIEHAE